MRNILYAMQNNNSNNAEKCNSASALRYSWCMGCMPHACATSKASLFCRLFLPLKWLVQVFWLSVVVCCFFVPFCCGTATHCANKSTSWFACQRKWMSSSGCYTNNNNCKLHSDTATKHSNICGYKICLPIPAKRAAKWHSSGGLRWLRVCLSVCPSAWLLHKCRYVCWYIVSLLHGLPGGRVVMWSCGMLTAFCGKFDHRLYNAEA